ncbi:uncharacterized protein RCC_10089 [Ramularia collo-cygni]|uniref:Uncharacterized protein n=1 Tax=Ramularia collo-cygni TaxID=112498 RepID=A0A2D3VNA5_9PEZI|nr:uncharacterized protein RCC_10089 [Ramularia collo-cygni]CZT24364.1 uncharacterized protein RCC_10089 [Ramularia collo-cygni]
MSDFEDHVSPILLPPRTAAQKLLTWRSLVGAEILQSARSRVFINLQYHYLGPGSKLLLDQKAAAILRETFSPSTTIEFSIKIHLPIPEGLKTQQGLPLTGLDVLGNVSESASEWRARVNEAAETFWRDWCLVNTMPDSDDRMEAIVDAAVEALLCGVDSIGDFWRPTFGPVLPPVMDFEREEVERRKRERDWQEVRERNRRIVVGDD